MFKTPTGAAGLSILSNSVLMTLKLAAGVLSGSVSVISEAIHSGMDLLASIIAFFSLRIARTPADESHPFGHGNYENVSGAAEALLIFAASIFIVIEAVAKLRAGTGLQSPAAGIAVMAVSVIVNFAISRYLLRMSKVTDSIAL